jgi:hypothetical protein
MTWRWVAWPSATVLLRLNAACAGALAFELLYLAGPSKLHGRARSGGGITQRWIEHSAYRAGFGSSADPLRLPPRKVT